MVEVRKEGYVCVCVYIFLSIVFERKKGRLSDSKTVCSDRLKEPLQYILLNLLLLYRLVNLESLVDESGMTLGHRPFHILAFSLFRSSLGRTLEAMYSFFLHKHAFPLQSRVAAWQRIYGMVSFLARCFLDRFRLARSAKNISRSSGVRFAIRPLTLSRRAFFSSYDSFGSFIMYFSVVGPRLAKSLSRSSGLSRSSCSWTFS